MNTHISHKNINIPKEDSVISLLTIYLDLNIDVLHAANNDRYADGNAIGFVNPWPIAIFSNYKTTTSSGNHLEDTSHAHFVSLLDKLLTGARDADALSFGSDRNLGRRKRESTNNETQNG